MRQFFSWRIWGAFVALALLAVGLKFVLPASASKDAAPIGPTPRTVQFISLVYAAKPSNTFAMDAGLVTGSIDFILDGQRTMHVYAGTPGDITCPDLTDIAKCVVLADLLGDAVVWFALVPVADGLKVELPPIVALLDDGIAQLSNGWHVPHASIVDRSCPQETSSMTEFIRDFGPESTTIVDVAKQEITQVRCSPKVTVGTSG
ncbi:MAG: hypothetical protein JWN62_57 [Acidimicrobiales bacterium]|nr:hypothetical protein [Acidimicrobiales bacterium]